MDISLDREKLISLASSLAKDINTEADLNALSIELVKLTVETALNAELTEYLGYDKHGANKSARGNSRNGNTPKRLKGTHVEVGILTPHDRDASFEPQRVRKHQTRPGAGANHPVAIASARSDLPPPLFIWTASSSKSETSCASSTKRFTWRYASTWTVKRNCWA